MRNPIKRRAKERAAVESLMHGNLFGAAPGVRELAEVARTEREEGLPEVQVRQRIRSRLESQGLTMRAMLLPGLSRPLRRSRLRPLLHALADFIADRSKKRVGGAVDDMFAALGFDQWLEDYIWTYATTGEASPMLDGYTGTVHRQEIGEGEDKSTTVWLVATPASDIDALVEWFKEEAREAFPSETFSKRRGKSLEGAQYYRWNQEGRAYSAIATENISELYPDLFIADNDDDFLFCQRLIEKETERVKKLAERTARRGDIIELYTSPTKD